ncbi:MAG: DMT family transporter, partial [Raoultibacter sp.]
AYMFYLQGIADAGPVRASLLCCVEPIAAMALSYVWLHTAVSVYDLIGCALILTMVFLVTQKEKQTEEIEAVEVVHEPL